ncbi:hypothetical protein DKP78_14445, partial [Enterococcus faecium]
MKPPCLPAFASATPGRLVALCVHANGGQTLLTGGAHVEGGLDDQQPLAHCVEGKEQGVWPLERGEHKLLINQSRRGFFCQPMTG